jgi:hypothetical protein
MNLLIKALLFGLALAGLGLIISTLLMLMQPGFKWSKYHFWPSVALSYFISGALIYIGSYAVGLDSVLCSSN